MKIGWVCPQCGKSRKSKVCPTCLTKRPVQPEIDRFWSYVSKTPTCWLWEGAKIRGYGAYTFLENQWRAHRLAYVFQVGPIPFGLNVLHRCDNPPCCNPKHLFLGTHAENVADRHSKGRDASGDRNGKRTRPDRVVRGEHTAQSKLTEAQVRAIRADVRNDMETSRDYSVSNVTIRAIRDRRTWKHVN